MELLVVGLDIEVDASVRLIGKTIIDNLLYQLLLFDDMSCSMRLDRGAQHTKHIHILMVAVGIVLGYLHGFQLLQASLLGNLVLTLVSIVLQVTHISDVAHIANLVTQVLQITEQQVKGDGRTGMTQMGVAIDGGTTDIHAHIGGMQRLEALLLARQRIIDNQFRFHILCKFGCKDSANQTKNQINLRFSVLQSLFYAQRQ